MIDCFVCGVWCYVDVKFLWFDFCWVFDFYEFVFRFVFFKFDC